MKTIFKLLIPLCAVAAILGCQGYSATGGPGRTVNPKLMSSVSSPRSLLHVNSILIMPVEFVGQARAARQLDERFERELESVLSQNVGIRVELASELMTQTKSSNAQAARAITPAKVLSDHDLGSEAALSQAMGMDLARAQALDSLLFTRVNQYQERSGSAAGSSSPASVNFDMQLVASSSGEQLWSANYHFRDEALTENLFKLGEHVSSNQTGKRGIGWRSAHEVLVAAFSIASSDLAQRRSASFGLGTADEVAGR